MQEEQPSPRGRETLPSLPQGAAAEDGSAGSVRPYDEAIVKRLDVQPLIKEWLRRCNVTVTQLELDAARKYLNAENGGGYT
jgi:hypothetical protein